jgi:hypothetical protein
MKAIIILTAALTFSTTSQARGFKLSPGEPLRTNAEIHAAKGRNGFLIRQKLSFGPYYTTQVRRSAIRKWYDYSGAPGLFWAEHMVGRQSIVFTLTNGTETIHVETVTHVRSTDIRVGDRPNIPGIIINILSNSTAAQANNFTAILSSGSNAPTWELFLDNTAAQLARKEPAGYLRTDSAYYTIVPVWTVDRKGKTATLPFGAIGLEFQDEEGKTQAAVSLQDNGEVYLNPDNKNNKQTLAAACAALLLQSNID